jgi:hypothetical protein
VKTNNHSQIGVVLACIHQFSKLHQPWNIVSSQKRYKPNSFITCLIIVDERYICTANYVPQNTDEIPLEKGSVVEVLEKNLDGWWFGR